MGLKPTEPASGGRGEPPVGGGGRPWGRRALLAPALVALVTGVLGGLIRLGVPTGAPASAVLGHGPLMVCGFFGTLISLERAVALGSGWAFAGPLVGAAAVAATLAGAPIAPAALFTAAALGLTTANLVIVRRQPALFTVVMASGSAAWLVGNLRWALGATLYDVVPWWLGFLVLTIASERLELSRLAPKPRAATRAFAVLVAATLGALALGSHALLGASFLGLAGWMASWDVARRTIRLRGLPRYAATALFAGYGWLATAGVLLLARVTPPAGPYYDAVIHTVMVGFVFSMVFAHAPIVLPAVARIALPFRSSFYVPLATLHLAVLLRVIGDLTGTHALRSAGGVLSAISLVIFAAAAIDSARRPPR